MDKSPKRTPKLKQKKMPVEVKPDDKILLEKPLGKSVGNGKKKFTK
jgi:hypothetical protein